MMDELSDTWVWPGYMARKAYEDGRFDGPPDDNHGPACQCADCMWDETDTDSMMASWKRGYQRTRDAGAD